MKIANLIVTSQNGGAEQVFCDYGRILSKLGHDVVPIVKNDAPYANKLINPKKISNHFGYHDFFAIKKIAKILHDEEIEAIFTHAGKASILARKAIAKVKNRKIFQISVNHSNNVKRSIGSDIILSINRPIFFKTIDAGQPQDRSFVMHNAVDLNDAVSEAPKIDLTNKRQIILGIIGRLDPTKGFAHAIRALKNLDQKFVLKIAGSGPFESSLRNLVKELSLENRVEFLGWTDKKSFFETIDIFIFPSDEEPFGLVLLESMKYGKPVIVSRVDGPKEIVRDGLDALMFDDPQQISQFVEKLVSDKDLANLLVENSLNRVKEKFSFRNLEQRLAEIVGKIH